MRRRHVVWGAVGTAAAVAGAAAWQWHQSATGALSGEAHEDIWALRLPRPEGGELVMSTLRGRPVLLNFWATWCPPCIKEMPLLDRFQREQAARWHVVGWAVDKEAPVRDYLKRLPVGFAIGLTGFEGSAISRRLGNEQGALPFTAIFDARGLLVERHLGETSLEQLQQWASRHS